MPLALEIRDAVRALAQARRPLPPARLDRPFTVMAAGTGNGVPTAVVPTGQTAIASALSPIEMIVMAEMAEMAVVVEAAAMLEIAVMLEAKIVPKIAPALAAFRTLRRARRAGRASGPIRTPCPCRRHGSRHRRALLNPCEQRKTRRNKRWRL